MTSALEWTNLKADHLGHKLTQIINQSNSLPVVPCLPLSWCGRAPACGGVLVWRCVWRPVAGGGRRRTGWAPAAQNKSERWPPHRPHSRSGSTTAPGRPGWGHRPSCSWGEEWMEGGKNMSANRFFPHQQPSLFFVSWITEKVSLPKNKRLHLWAFATFPKVISLFSSTCGSLTVWPAEAGQGESPAVAGPGQVEPLEEGAAALQVSQGGVIQPGPVRLQTQLGVLQRVTAVLVQQLTALGQTAEVWQGQVAQYQLDELWMEDGERG